MWCLQIIVMVDRAAVFAVQVCCESGSMHFSVEHIWVDLSEDKLQNE